MNPVSIWILGVVVLAQLISIAAFITQWLT